MASTEQEQLAAVVRDTAVRDTAVRDTAQNVHQPAPAPGHGPGAEPCDC